MERVSLMKDGFDVIISLASIMVSCIALYISINTNQKQYNLALLDQRFEIYNACQKFVTYILLNNDCNLEELQKFKLGTIKAKFLFGKDVLIYIDSLYKVGVELTEFKSGDIYKKMSIVDRVELLREGMEFRKYLKIV